MKVKKASGIRWRSDVFGGVVYVPYRDDFFAVDREVFHAVSILSDEWIEVSEQDAKCYRILATLGICQCDPAVEQVAYSGPSFLGNFLELPTVTEPLVLNCFSTSHCPLMCRYCHADDLMQEYRDTETATDIDNVIATASMIPAMVAVITGGDPLTVPDRANKLIQGLAKQKAIVLDTSGVGYIEALLPALVSSNAHVRVSLDSISEVNDKVRVTNPKYSRRRDSSRVGSLRTILACLENGVPVTVQTVVSRFNENLSELLDLRDAMVSWGVQNWVLHVAIRGGLARKVEDQSSRQSRKRGILPSPSVYELVSELIADTKKSKIKLDIRCTDTDQTPNSVLLVGSRGDLFTEGLAHRGKVQLFSAGNGRPDLVRSLWHHVDRFGHARRYFNWNPWLNSSNLRDICVSVPQLSRINRSFGTSVETETKAAVTDSAKLREILQKIGFEMVGTEFQRDEYYDEQNRTFSGLDFVIRVRDSKGQQTIGLKGPRFFTSNGAYSRVELEFESKSKDAAIAAMKDKNLTIVWYFEKKRATFRRPKDGTIVFVDEVPKLGEFIEIEGEPEKIQSIRQALEESIGSPECRNYGELFKDFMQRLGVEPSQIAGAEFEDSGPQG